MSNPPMYGSLLPLDREVHKKLKLKTDLVVLPRVANQNSIFLTVVEFPDACKEFPIVFVRVGEVPTDGRKQAVAPLCVTGLKSGVNLFVKGDQWTGNYLPAYVRRYPFAMARLEGSTDDTLAICFDNEWPGFNETEGNALFQADGQATEFLLNAKNFLESFEQEAERTRQACAQLAELELLREMRFEATLPNQDKLEVEGFLAVDEQKLAELPDDKVVQLHRSGLLALLEMHRVSLGNMNRLAGQHAAVPEPAKV